MPINGGCLALAMMHLPGDLWALTGLFPSSGHASEISLRVYGAIVYHSIRRWGDCCSPPPTSRSENRGSLFGRR